MTIFLDRLWVHPFVSHPPFPHDNVVTPNGLISTHFAQNSKLFGLEEGKVASFTNIIGKVPTLLTSVVAMLLFVT